MLRRLPLIVCFLMVCQGCTFSASERCGKGFEWKNNTCVKVYAVEDGGDEDAGGDAATGELAGLGEKCEEMGTESCSQYKDLYCAINPTNTDPGYCTIQNCTPGGKDCPDGYECCRANPMVPYLCLTDADFDQLKEASVCPG